MIVVNSSTESERADADVRRTATFADMVRAMRPGTF